MKKASIIIIAIILMSCTSYARKLDFGMSVGMGTYSMKTLSEINAKATELNKMPLKKVDNFPDWVYFKPYAFLEINQYCDLGVFMSYNSTASRLSYKDYSGEIGLDFVTDCISTGASIEVKSVHFGNFYFTPYFEAGLSFSNLQRKEFKYMINSQTGMPEYLTNNNDNFSATSIVCEPGMRFYYNFDLFKIGLQAGYFYDFNGNYDITKVGGVRHTSYYGYEFAKTNWDGFRFALQFAVHTWDIFPEKEKKPKWF